MQEPQNAEDGPALCYVMTPDSLCCPEKDNRPQNQHRDGIMEG